MAFIMGAIIGGGLGLIGANQQSKAIDKQTAAQMAGFKQYEPYVDNMLEGSQGAMDTQLAAGYYGGPTYAGPNGLQTNTAATMGIHCTLATVKHIIDVWFVLPITSHHCVCLRCCGQRW